METANGCAPNTLNFKKDTLSILFTSGREPEVMIFSQHHDTLQIKKVSGTGACVVGTEGWYRIEWFENGDPFLLHNLSDDCNGRAAAFTANRFEKMKEVKEGIKIGAEPISPCN